MAKGVVKERCMPMLQAVFDRDEVEKAIGGLPCWAKMDVQAGDVAAGGMLMRASEDAF